MKFFQTAIFAACLTILPIQQALAGDALSPTELKNLAPGRYRVTLMGTVSMIVTLRQNGTVLGSMKAQHDAGRWNLSGTNLCIAWNKWLGGQARCSQLVSQGNYYQGSGFTFKRI